MVASVYFSSLVHKVKYKSPLDKIKKLLEECNVSNIFSKNDLVAIKIHFGELGNTGFIRPILLRPVIEKLKKIEAKPYLTDTNTLYVGSRSNSVDHLHNANLNGFNYSTLQVPVIIADGLRGENSCDIEVNLPIFKKVKLANDIVNADGMVCVSHFKGHEISGFAGTIKNLSMGCASRQGKLDMHSTTKPLVTKNCTKCGRCIKNCQFDAIEMKDKAFITTKCVGCVRCIAICPAKAIKVNWNETSDNTQKKMIEYAYGVTKSLKQKVIYINILANISSTCDCYVGNDKPVISDIGYLASTDPIALDKASYDMVVKAAGEDIFQKMFPNVNINTQFDYAKQLNFGTCEYNLVEID
ncbi:MAG: 4Fe-4S ferredoxin [Spirochaetes bacterium GWD1_27_9]|nr:MAG: 4Fe-4S ferredoxin [Spirochaetes bacterium GWB1_27_13]OHD27438.1 MAG: 4Fe-4S ferredoxin [Spirochaetes bacterium GWC1_27_15]OHD44309.1 MAG: 4Fe-4S ferredoxin [Spirochaetes bacterium GWD1_27_9]